MRRQANVGVCQRRSMAATTGKPSLWDPRSGREEEGVFQDRHHQAAVLCQQCPLLDACEAALSAHEKVGVYIAGVVAGRYSDVARRDNENRLVHCRSCGDRMLPQAVVGGTAKQRKHVGEGLCDWCYPQWRRAARIVVGAA